MSQHPRIILFTYGDDPQKIRFVKEPYTNVGLGKKYVDTFSKFEALREAMRDGVFTDGDIVCFVDGYDVMQFGDLDEVREKFLSFGVDFVVGAETNCWPSPWMAHLFPPSTTKYRFPNIGTYCGYGWAVRKVLEWDVYRQAYDDQGYFHDFYLKNLGFAEMRIALDVHCVLFQQCTFVPWRDFAYDTAGRLYNAKCATQPCFFHFNGKSDLLRDGVTSVMDIIHKKESLEGLLQFHNVIYDS